MAKEMVWYEVIDITSYGIKYPNDWYARCGYDIKRKENSVCESLGAYSCMKNAIDRLKKWCEEKGIKYDYNKRKFDDNCGYFEHDLMIDCMPVLEVGIYFDMKDNQVNISDNDCQKDNGTRQRQRLKHGAFFLANIPTYIVGRESK